jgi:predicted dehydrogenase
MSQLPIKFAVVGFGHIGKRHAEMIKRNPHSKLVAVADTDNSLEKSCTEIYQVPFFNSIEQLVSSGIEIDVINVCTPNGSHAKLAIKALESKHHVVLEKPMGLTKASCEEVIYKSLQMSRQVFCVMQNRYSPPSVWLKKLIDTRVLGEVYMVQVNCYWNRDDRYYKKGGWKGTKEDGGPLFTQFSHFMDLLYWCFGDITDIKTNFANFNHSDNTVFKEDSGFVSFKFVGGGLGTFNYSTSVWDKNLESSMTVIAEKGSIKVGGQYMDKVEYCHIDNYTMPELPPTNPPNDYGPYKGSAANHHYIIENVVDVLTGANTITTNALEGLKVVDIIERIYQNL